MTKSALFLIIICFLYSCSSKTDEDIYSNLKSLEFSRVKDTTFYSPYAESKDPTILSDLAITLGRIQDESHLPLLKPLLYSSVSEVKKNTIFSIGQIGSEECEQVLTDLYSDKAFLNYKKDIIYALGKCGKQKTALFLMQNLDILNDSLKAAVIQNLAFIYKRIDPDEEIPLTILKYLNSKSEKLSYSAIYFFRRNDFPDSVKTILKMKYPANSLAFKYQLTTFSNIFEKQLPDSESTEILRDRLLTFKTQSADWREDLYRARLLSCIHDSLAIEVLKDYLKDTNPHLRIAAIESMGKMEDQIAKQILLDHYDTAGWTEKGYIIRALAKRYPAFIYRLIQQNLDKGTIYSKELLLESLAAIRDDFSRDQLHQFLGVPSPRLQASAFQELDKLYGLTYKDVRPLLFSKDIVLAYLAADWLSEHTEYGVPEDLIQVYSDFKEPQDAETMASILKALNSLQSKKAIAFLDSIYTTTANNQIAEEAAKGLKDFKINYVQRKMDSPKLFVPDSINFNSEPVLVSILTDKGKIKVELWPGAAPATVANFLYLAKRGFYNNLTFHRVISDFVIQGGDPRGDGWGGPGYSIPCEYNGKPFKRGSIGMATSGKDTGGSQFFICHSEQPHLNRRYTNFGIVVEGMPVVDQILIDDKILKVTINH